METNDVTPEVKSEQTQEVQIDRSIKQKGYLPPILAAIVVLLIVGIGGYFLYSKQTDKTAVPSEQISQTTNTTNPLSTTQPSTSSKYQNTTKGLELSLSGKFIVCDYPTSDVKLGEAASCDLLRDSKDTISVETYNQSHQPTLSSISLKTNQESLHDWVIRVSNAKKKNMPEEVMGSTVTQSDNILDMGPTTVLDEVTQKNTLNGTSTNNYQSIIYKQQGDNIIVLQSGYSTSQGQYTDKLKSLLPSIQTIPVTTGDLGMNIGWTHNGNSGTYVNFTGNLYASDQKTIAATIKTDSQGQYFVRLKPGTYYFIQPDGTSKQITISLGLSVIPLPTFNITTERDMFNIPAPSSPPTQ